MQRGWHYLAIENVYFNGYVRRYIMQEVVHTESELSEYLETLKEILKELGK